MIYAILVLSLLLGSCTQAAVQEKELAGGGQDLSRLAGIYVKDGNANGQLRFLASGLGSSTSTTGLNSNTGLNSALNQYITNKQDMLEQLRPSTATGTFATGTGLVTGTTTGTTGTGTTGTGLVTTTANGAIYVNLGNSGTSSTSSSSSTSATNQAIINQAIYGSSPIADLLPQIVGQAVASRRRPGQVNRRRVVGNRRRVNKRRGSVNNNQIQRRRRRGNKGGKNKAQVMVVRPNRG